jgi:hypothetical protein
MEASENRGLPPMGGGGTGLHRVEPHVVAEILAASEHATGFSRLELMLDNVLGRLVAVDRPQRG